MAGNDDGNRVLTIRLTHCPGGFDVAYDGQSLWTANSGMGTVSRLTRDGEVIGMYPVGAAPANVLYDGEAIWVSNTSDDTVSKITLP